MPGQPDQPPPPAGRGPKPLLIVRLLVRLFPLRTPPEFAQASPAALLQKYSRVDLAGVAAFFVLGPLGVYLSHEAMVAYSKRLAPPLHAGSYLLTSTSGFWYIPAFFIGTVLACVLIHLAYRILLPDGGRENRYAANAHAGFEISRMYLTIAILMVAFGGAITYFAARTSLELGPNEMVIHRMWSSQEERHSYADVAALKDIYDLRHNKHEFVIEFSNAEPWTTAVEVIFPQAEHRVFLTHVTGKSVQHEMR